MSFAQSITGFMLFVLAATGISDFLRSRAVDLHCWEETWPRRWLVWGRVYRGGRLLFRYLELELPSWEWRWNEYTQRECWRQRILHWNSYDGFAVYLHAPERK